MRLPLCAVGAVSAAALLVSACSSGPSEGDQQACQKAGQAVETIMASGQTSTVSDFIDLTNAAKAELEDAYNAADDTALSDYLTEAADKLSEAKIAGYTTGGSERQINQMFDALDNAASRCDELGVNG